MCPDQKSNRQLKKEIQQFLLQEDFKKGLSQISDIPARKAVNPLFSFLYSLDELLKWRAVMAMGEVVTRLADEDMESARVIMRRAMWQLNDESGGIGWGCPEAMGEIMARNENLAAEFWCILISYIRPDGNFLEHEILQRGVLWGVGRLAQARPQLLRDSGDYLIPYLQAEDAYLRGLAAWASKALRNEKIDALLNGLTEDGAQLSIFQNGHLMQCSVGQLAQQAIDYDINSQHF
ncbi:MAG: HEAT repeat domain-containing protein [Desulfobacterales bacterium]|jgi:hypothetical protein